MHGFDPLEEDLGDERAGRVTNPAPTPQELSMNEITLHGHVGNPPRIYHSGSGQSAVRFSLGVSDGYYDRRTGQWRNAPTVWHEVAVFGPLAEHVYDSLMAAEPGTSTRGRPARGLSAGAGPSPAATSGCAEHDRR